GVGMAAVLLTTPVSTWCWSDQANPVATRAAADASAVTARTIARVVRLASMSLRVTAIARRLDRCRDRPVLLPPSAADVHCSHARWAGTAPNGARHRGPTVRVTRSVTKS